MLGLTGFKRRTEGVCWHQRPLPLFVILDAVLCALKCIFVLIDNLLWHISTVFFWYDDTASTRHYFIIFFFPGFWICFYLFYFWLSFVSFLLVLFFLLPSLPPSLLGKYISKYTTVLINKSIFKVAASWDVWPQVVQLKPNLVQRHFFFFQNKQKLV